MPSAGSSAQRSQDVFSLSDQVLSERLQFVEEIGFGNWGSVWLCKPKVKSESHSEDAKIAVKLVHRSKTPTTAARVRSLWNEMKIIRSFKEDPHPSIIPFHSFIITPSFALITMAYLPTLVPVEVPEEKCKEWFRSLLSGVEFLHKRGVVHNDIKPANILLTPERVPVLVDFGFAEKYDVQSSKAFHSNLSYGTPEYLSPERARGLPHDTRKSDMWSLGVTFFEILVGRTPFENTDGEQLTTKEDLERYWGRTMKGKWLGTWSFSKGAEKLLKRMIAPNADLRCNASDAFADTYWNRPRESSSTPTLHRRAASATSSLTSSSSNERDTSLQSSTRSKLAGALSPWTRSLRGKKGESSNSFRVYDESSPSPSLKLAKSVSNLRRTISKPDMKARLVPKQRAQPLNTLSPIKASPPATPRSIRPGKENTPLRPRSHYPSPLGQPSQTRSDESMQFSRERLHRRDVSQSTTPSRPPLDLTAMNRHLDSVVQARQKDRKGDKVSQRVLEWEREKERLREMSRLEDLEKETDDDAESFKSSAFSKISRVSTPLQTPATPEEEEEDDYVPRTPPNGPVPTTPSSVDLGIHSFAHNLKLSLSKTVERYKVSMNNPVKSPTRTETSSFDLLDESQWNDQAQAPDAVDSTLPVVHTALENERASQDNQTDRLVIWMRNVEKVVEDTRQNFASSSGMNTLPALPIAPPLSRSTSSVRNPNRSSRLPRKALAASQIFTATDEFGEVQRVGKSLDLTLISDASTANATVGIDNSLLQTPTRPRRATVSTGSPQRPELSGSPSRSRSHANLLQRHIVSPESMRRIEMGNLTPQKTPRAARLSAVIDPSLFVAPTSTSKFRENLTLTPERPEVQPMTLDELSASPCIVEPYPARKPLAATTAQTNEPTESPRTQKRVEGVFDRYLMTTGVKRLGAGYQSHHTGPVQHRPLASAKENANNENDYNANAVRRRSSKLFLSTKRHMPPPVSSDDYLKPPSATPIGYVDELGMINGVSVPEGRTPMKDSTAPVSVMKRALRAMSVNRKLSSRA